MASSTLKFNDEVLAVISTEDELRNTLFGIRSFFTPRNPILELVNSNGNSLYLAISAEGCQVEYMDASLDPPYFVSVGNPSLSADKVGVVTYQMSRDNHFTEISLRYIIDFESLLHVAAAFFERGTRPEELIDWEII